MAKPPNRRRRPISQPGQSGGMSGAELRKLLEDDCAAAPEYVMKESKPVQEVGPSGSPNMNIAEPEGGNESHLSSPVSEYGQKGRNRFKSSGSNPVSEENYPGQFSEKRQNELVNLNGPGDTQESEEDVESDFSQESRFKGHLQRQQNKSLNQSENIPLTTTPVLNLMQPQNTSDLREQVMKSAKSWEFERDQGDESFEIPSSELSSGDSLKDILTSFFSQRSMMHSSKHSFKLDDLLTFMAPHHQSLQTKLSINESESFNYKALLQSLIKRAYKPNDPDNIDASIPSLRSFILMLSMNSGKNNSLDQKTRQLSSLVAPDNEMSAILRAECCEPNCSKALCQRVQQCLRNLQEFEVSVTNLTEEQQMVLFRMYEHCDTCRYLHCPLYWCQKEAFYGITDPKEILIKMKQLLEHGYHDNFLDDLKKEIFSPFLQSLGLTCTPREPEEWSGLCRLTGANNTILVQSAMEENGKYWILKKCRMFKSCSQMDLYEKLRQISPKGIAQHLWTAFCPDTRFMAVCMEHETFSLYERLQESPIKNLQIVVRIMLQLINTTRHLHEEGILYLNWSSKNIIYSTPEHIKLTNFTCSALKSRINEDIGDICLSLPQQLIAPEMLEAKPAADEKTDIRGLGCLLKEIVSGRPVWYEHLHEPDNVLHKKIMEKTPSKPDCLELFRTFKTCWERERSIRSSLEELEINLVEAKDSQNHK